jgi:hypothetical protein
MVRSPAKQGVSNHVAARGPTSFATRCALLRMRGKPGDRGSRHAGKRYPIAASISIVFFTAGRAIMRA